MKVGILTFYFAKNIGAQLQAFALCQVLKKMGFDVSFVRYEPDYLRAPYSFFRNVKKRYGVASMIKQSLLHIAYDSITWCRTTRHYAKFQKEFIPRSRSHCNSTDDLLTADYDAFIVGSDQIWNPELTAHQIDSVYTLNFSDKSKRKIAYAASFSDKHISKADLDTLISHLCSFDRISVREKNLAQLIEKNSNLDVDVVLDPTLLLSKEDWIKFINPQRLVKEPYVLLYQARGSKDKILKQTERIAYRIGARVIDASGMNYRVKQNGMQYVHPIEFLNLIFNAEMIVTASFHGTALSVILEKPFYSILLNDERDERVINLLNTLGLQSQMKNVEDDLAFPMIDYLKHKKTFVSMRDHSLNFLKDAL
ncbi:MAG: polysaccharide pyruvyl transferase family protein [Eubacteriales bacterium]